MKSNSSLQNSKNYIFLSILTDQILAGICYSNLVQNSSQANIWTVLWDVSVWVKWISPLVLWDVCKDGLLIWGEQTDQTEGRVWLVSRDWTTVSRKHYHFFRMDLHGLLLTADHLVSSWGESLILKMSAQVLVVLMVMLTATLLAVLSADCIQHHLDSWKSLKQKRIVRIVYV